MKKITANSLKKFLADNNMHRYDICKLLNKSKRTIDRYIVDGIDASLFELLQLKVIKK